MGLPPTDFKSVVYTNSTTTANGIAVNSKQNYIWLLFFVIDICLFLGAWLLVIVFLVEMARVELASNKLLNAFVQS